MKRTITVAIISHKLDYEKFLEEQVMTQERLPDEILIMCTQGEGKELYTSHPNVTIEEVPNMNDYGHEKRAFAMHLANSDYITFWNADDEYDKEFIKILMNEVEKDDFKGVIYTDFTSHLFGGRRVNSEPTHARITSGNFIVHTNTALNVGYNHRHYQADWEFIHDLLKAEVQFRKAENKRVLYNHR